MQIITGLAPFADIKDGTGAIVGILDAHANQRPPYPPELIDRGMLVGCLNGDADARPTISVVCESWRVFNDDISCMC